MQSGFIEILNALHDRRVDFVIVGGIAAVLHGGSRVTFDLDVVPSLRSICWSGKATLSTSSSSEQSR